MFRDGNNQAMGLVMQGYSDSIKVNQDRALGNSFRDFNKSIGDSLDTYQRSEANKAATQAQQLQNEYSQRTMDDKVGLVGQELRSAKLANDYSQRTMDDRAGIVKQNLDSLKHQNYITGKTRGTQIRATNSRNNINAQLDENHYMQYNRTPIKQIKGRYYTQDKNGNFTNAINQDQAQRIMKTNAQVQQNRDMSGNKYVASDAEAISRAQAQHAQNISNMNAIDRYSKHSEQLAQQFNNESIPSLAKQVDEAVRSQSPTITLSNGQEIPTNQVIDYLNRGNPLANATPIGYSNTINNNNSVTTNVNASNLPVIEKKANATRILLDEESSPEQKQQARLILQQDKQYKDTAKAIYGGASILSSFKDLLDKDRIDMAIGTFTRYLGGGEEFARMDANAKKVLAEIGTSSMKGSLTNYELKIAKGQVPSLWESQPATMSRIHVGLGQVLNKIEGNINAMGEAGHRILSPEVLQQYNSIKSFYEAISPNK